MDKEWMSKNRLSPEYDIGVESFLKFALKNVDDPDAIPCPCAKCGNIKKKNVQTIRAHLYSNGIDLTYHTWIWHGERCTSRNSMNDNVRASQGVHKTFAEEPVDIVQDVYDSYVENPNQFTKLLEDAEKPLYPGCTKFTKLSAIVKLFNLKAKYSWSDKSFTDMLLLFGEMLPDKNELPLSLYDENKSLRALGMDYEYEDFANCPPCGTSRWKVGNNSKVKADAPCWKLVDHKWPDFASEPRNLRLAISADGVNPHSLMSSAYSCWPVLMITYNLPPWLCMKRKFVMLTLLISGPRQPGNDIDVYLAPLIDDLKCLWDTGVESYDAYQEESFSLKAVLLWTINDFPAYGNMSGCVVKGYHACPICAENTYSTRLKHSRKMSYTGHRRFLPLNHPYRRQKKTFNGNQEFNPAPNPLSGHEVLERVEKISYQPGKLTKKPQSNPDDGKPCWKKNQYSLNLSIGNICMFVMFLM
ncbi:uncharacterized protein [Henckelia pumila]|uniref:uncharacterized protein n=1 Tax=Henckelia pumila TaxID=405737 RepID=UPI003C6E1EA0